MPRHALLEITVSGRNENTCGVDVRFERPDDQTAGERRTGEIALDLDALVRLRHDRKAYGAALAAALFASPEVEELFTSAKDELARVDTVRLRLHVSSVQSPLHNVLWETLADPADGQRWLLTNERFVFSRYVVPERRAWRRSSATGAMRVLIVVGNPPQLANTDYFDPAARAANVQRHLAPIDVNGEIERVRAALDGHLVEVLATDAGNPTATTVRNIVAKLHGDYDVLYIVCHGALRRVDAQSPPEPLLYLGSEDGKSPAVLGASLITGLRDLPILPRLVVLVSCHSAGGEGTVVDDGGAFMTLAPGLARLGVPAVLGMQGAVTMQTMAEFMPQFFVELAKDGQIDRAVASARAFVKNAADAWMPTLYLQSRDGRLWAPAGAHAMLSGFQDWSALIETIKAGDCTAVIGSGLFDSTFVPQATIASRWMKEEGLPLVEHGREDLAHVAQYVATLSGEDKLRARWRETLTAELRERYDAELQRDEPDFSYDDLDKLLSAVGALRASQVAETPHQVLAELPFKIFVVTTPDNLMADALNKAKKKPIVEIFRWKESLEGLPSITDVNRAYRPTERSPLVYHLLGHVKYPASVVVSEDHYLEWLTRINNPAVHTITTVETSLKEFPLLLLGFQFEDWDFRVLFRAIAAGNRSKRTGARVAPPSVAVQLDPDDRFVQPKLMQRYIERYFGIANLSISWGSPEGFARELWRKWQMVKEGHRV